MAEVAENQGNEVVVPRREAYQERLEVTLDNIQSVYSRGSTEYNNFTGMTRILSQRDTSPTSLEELMNEPEESYMKSYFFGVVISWTLGGRDTNATYSSGRNQRGGNAQRAGTGTINYERMIRIGCVNSTGATNVATFFVKSNAERGVYASLNMRDSGAFGKILRNAYCNDSNEN